MRDPEPLSSVLSEFISRRGLARVQGDAQLMQVWSDVVGSEMASRTKVIGLRRGILEVGVSSSGLLNELVAFHRAGFLKRMQSEYAGEIQDIRFRLQSTLSG